MIDGSISSRCRQRQLCVLMLLLVSAVAAVAAFISPSAPAAAAAARGGIRQRRRHGGGWAAAAPTAVTVTTVAAAADDDESEPPPPPPQPKKGLEAAFGKGKGKHQRAQTRKKKNKYAGFSKVGEGPDPLEAALREAALANDPSLARREAEEARRQEERIRGEVEYPSIQEIDPYEPNTFGFIEAGVVLGAHGVDGMVRVRATSDVAEEALGTEGLRHIKGPKRRYPRPLPVTEARPTVDDIYLLKFEGIDDREAAANLRDFKVYMREEERPELEEDEFFVRDMIGMDVVLVGMEDVSIGRVVDVVTAETERQGLANDLLEIELLNEEEEQERGKARGAPPPTFLVLVPFVKQIVPVVDMRGRTLHIDPPPGLLDLAYQKEERIVVRGALPTQSQFSTMQDEQEKKNARGRKRRKVSVKRPASSSDLEAVEGEGEGG